MADDFSLPLYNPYRNPSLEEYSSTKTYMNSYNVSYQPITITTSNDMIANNTEYQGVPNNLHWTGSQSYNAQLYCNPDEEVSFITNHKPDQHFSVFEDNRCSSTDTTLSSASHSTVFSNSSMNEDDTFLTPLDRKRKLNQNEARESKPSKKRNNGFTYKRWPKPPYSYTGLIATVIMNSKNGSLSLTDIQEGMSELFPFFRGSYQGWKDSVRNYLTKFSCFVKVQNGLFGHNTHLWTVDKTKLTLKMFKRQERKNVERGDYKATIQEQLNLPPIQIPDYCDVTNNGQHSELSMRIVLTPKPIKTDNCVESRTKFNVKLPKVNDCVSKTESPFSTYTFKRKESLVSEKMESSAHDTSLPEVQTGTPSSSYYEDWFNSATLNDVKQFIQSERRTSQAAVEHLNSLCFGEVNSAESSNEVKEMTEITSIRDIFTKTAPRLQVDDNDDYDLSVVNNLKQFTDYSISGIVLPTTPEKIVGSSTEVEYLDISDDEYEDAAENEPKDLVSL
ncbi:Forkhead box [Mactra antiquata]